LNSSKCNSCKYMSTPGNAIRYCILLLDFIEEEMPCKGKLYEKSKVTMRAMEREKRVEELRSAFKGIRDD
jgi:hypothetical protein